MTCSPYSCKSHTNLLYPRICWARSTYGSCIWFFQRASRQSKHWKEHQSCRFSGWCIQDSIYQFCCHNHAQISKAAKGHLRSLGFDKAKCLRHPFLSVRLNYCTRFQNLRFGLCSLFLSGKYCLASDLCVWYCFRECNVLLTEFQEWIFLFDSLIIENLFSFLSMFRDHLYHNIQKEYKDNSDHKNTV